MRYTLLLFTIVSILSSVDALLARPTDEIPGAQGNYGGLLQVPDADVPPPTARPVAARHVVRGHLPNETPLNSGTLTAQVGVFGRFSAVLNWQGFKYSFIGEIDPSTLMYERELADRGNPGQSLALKLTLHTDTRILHCDLTAFATGTFYTAQGDLSGAEPDPAAGQAFAGSLNTSFIDPPGYGSLPQDVAGDGFSVTRVSKKAGFAARIIGRLPDNEPFSAGSFLRGSDYTIFSGLYFKQGRFGGLTIGQLSVADLVSIQNVLLWAKRENVDRGYYPAGFETGYGIKTLAYILNSLGKGNPQRPIPKISTTPGPVRATLVFKEGNLGRDAGGQDITLTAKIRINLFGATVLAPNPQRISLQTNALAGTWSGSFNHPISGRRTHFHGGFIQANGEKNGEGRGSFKGSLAPTSNDLVESGSVRMTVD